ncbi:flavin reductase [Candidatus Pacearchaeota archaeon]|nr:flavin reductase [Candidatus Pacearchaeota archaeon]
MGLLYTKPSGKIEVSPDWTKYLLATHPVVFITTIGKASGRFKTDIAPFATCLDTSYNPPYVQISCAVNQHVEHGQQPTKAKMNTFLNINQNGLFIVNVPPRELLSKLDIVAKPYPRGKLEDKIVLAKLTKIEPFILPRIYGIYPPLIAECLVHLECKVVDIHRPKGSDHYNITGQVVDASYDESLGRDIDEIRERLVKRIWHHFGSKASNPNKRFIAYLEKDEIATSVTFHLEKASR